MEGKTANLEEPLLYEGKMPRCGQMTHDASLYRPFYFHPDHTSTSLSTGLGSSSYISNMSSRISQHMEYLPFGEILVEEPSNPAGTRTPTTAPTNSTGRN